MRTMLRAALGIALLGMLSTTAIAEEKPAQKDAVTAASEAATAWLKLVDAGDHAASWKEAAAYFQASVKEPQWVEAASAARKPLGKLVSRQLAGNQQATELPGAPDGEYVVLSFSSSFENKKKTIETVTMMKEKDGAWRASGYFIK